MLEPTCPQPAPPQAAADPVTLSAGSPNTDSVLQFTIDQRAEKSASQCLKQQRVENSVATAEQCPFEASVAQQPHNSGTTGAAQEAQNPAVPLPAPAYAAIQAALAPFPCVSASRLVNTSSATSSDTGTTGSQTTNSNNSKTSDGARRTPPKFSPYKPLSQPKPVAASLSATQTSLKPSRQLLSPSTPLSPTIASSVSSAPDSKQGDSAAETQKSTRVEPSPWLSANPAVVQAAVSQALSNLQLHSSGHTSSDQTGATPKKLSASQSIKGRTSLTGQLQKPTQAQSMEYSKLQIDNQRLEKQVSYLTDQQQILQVELQRLHAKNSELFSKLVTAVQEVEGQSELVALLSSVLDEHVSKQQEDNNGLQEEGGDDIDPVSGQKESAPQA